jgi:hypothetical protein
MLGDFPLLRIDVVYCSKNQAEVELDDYNSEGNTSGEFLAWNGTRWLVTWGPGTDGYPPIAQKLQAGFDRAQTEAERVSAADYSTDLKVVRRYTDHGSFPARSFKDCSLAPYAGNPAGQVTPFINSSGGRFMSKTDFFGDSSGYAVIIGCIPGANEFNVFFFRGVQFMGTDTAQPSRSLAIPTRTGNTVTVRYFLFEPGFAGTHFTQGSANGKSVDVTFDLAGDRIVPKNAIPVSEDVTNGFAGR